MILGQADALTPELRDLAVQVGREGPGNDAPTFSREALDGIRDLMEGRL